MRPRFPIIITIIVALLLFTGIAATITNGLHFFSNGVYWMFVVFITIGLLIFDGISSLVESEKFRELSSAQKEAFLTEKAKPFYLRLYDSAFGSVAESEEKALLLDHGYDGIQELDNKLPSWWLSLFYFGCFFLVAYMLAFSFTDFAHPIVELDTFNKKFDSDVKEYLATVPQKTPEQMAFDPSNVEKGKKIFESKCVTCHNQDGGAKGNSGANLTDDYWRNIHTEDLYQNIVTVVWNGSSYDKTMRGFGKRGEILGNDLEKVAAYVYHLNQDTDAPNGKAPLGKYVKPWAKDPAPADSLLVISNLPQYLAAKVDSLKALP